ncbi:MAG TPA: DUF308 domain-containing protein [Candidatus Faecimonas gallistercoris]|nr:DUF308 domain-containing protein [Candidatus Faecimonas gallistercoris]
MKKFLKSSIITSIILMMLGILLIFQSETTIMMISYIIGGVLVAVGALALIRYVKSGESPAIRNELDIIYGIVTIVFGVIIIRNYQIIASIIPIVIGIAIIVSSAGKLNYAFQLKASENSLWKTTMVVSVISTICGLILLFNPFKAALGIMKIIGGFIIVYSILDIISTFAIKSSVIKIHKAVEETITDAEIISEDDKKKSTKKRKKKK